MIDSGTILQDRFLIEDKIGSGGMGAVYRAIDQKFGSRVAIKQTFYGDTELAAAFEREARLLNGLHHPILPYVSDSFTENGGLFLVMEYIEGEDLSELLKRGETFPVDTVIGWAFDLLDGLDYLHSQDPPVIHRDIKPNNLKLTSRGKIVLLDFGMAKETSSNTLEAKSVFGYSRRYSPLEQIEGTGTDARSDIFSLGASLYHLITGTPPADVLARASAIVAGKEDPLIRADEVNSAVPEGVATLLHSALALNAEHRFESAEAMSDALEAAVNASHVSEVIPLTSPMSASAAAGSAVAESATGNVIQEPAPAVTMSHAFEPKPEPSEMDVVTDAEPSTWSRYTDKAFTTRSAVENFRNRVQSSLPASIPAVRIRRPSRSNYAVWLPILLLSLALVLWGTYRGFQPGEEEASNGETQPIVSDSPAADVAVTAPEETVQPEEQPVQSEENPVELKKGPVAIKKEIARTGDENVSEKEATRDKELNNRAVAQKPRSSTARASKKTVRPAFEQPAVSSIEAIMTGAPYERGRWDRPRDSWSDEELRRRRMMRRQRRYQQPY